MIRNFIVGLIFLNTACLVSALDAQQLSKSSDPLPGTAKLEAEGDIAFTMIDGVDRFLLQQWEEAADTRHQYWEALAADPERCVQEFPKLRNRLLEILGAQEERVPITDVQQVSVHFVAKSDLGDVYAVSWPVVRDVRGEGLLLVPAAKTAAIREAIQTGARLPFNHSLVVALPDADQPPEALVGLTKVVPEDARFPLHLLAENAFVLIPTLIDRALEKRNGRCTISNREFLYRPGFELGHHLLGYELQKIRAGIDWAMFCQDPTQDPLKISVQGYGEGGFLALLAGATDQRISNVGVSGYFSSHSQQWNEPIDRNLFGIWNQFGNAELALLALDAPLRAKVALEPSPGPDVELPGNDGGAPSHLQSPDIAEVKEEFAQLCKYTAQGDWKDAASLSVPSKGMFGTVAKTNDPAPDPPKVSREFTVDHPEQLPARITARAQRQRDQIEQDTQRLLVESPYVRADFMKKLDTSSLEKYAASVEPYRDHFAKKVMGQFELPLQEPKPHTRQVYDEKLWTGYEVVLDVFPDVIAYGLLLVPKNIPAGERRPVVVCQHGLEGRPQDVIGDSKRNSYEAFAAKLAERGYVTFAPQNLYLGKDRFRTLQRKANPLGKTLFSIIVPQHQQIAQWLQTLPFVDGDRMAFYGLSYGGKSAMRIPPLVPQYKAVICSADFNDWVWKNASTRAPYSYVWTGEYEIYEWNLGSTFSYAEMAALISPRPFMVERGHFDGVASDEAVAYEFAKVRHLYSARLKIPERCEMEVFDGPHKINGVGTFAFLDRHLTHTPTTQANDKP